MKNFFKDILFIIIFLFLLNVITNVFVIKGNGYGSDVISFYKEKKNSLDIIFFGSSHSYATFSPKVIEEELNLKSYNFATQQQPIYITYHYMKESLKTQHPKFFVLEARMLAVDNEYASEGTTRDAIDKMHLSINKINAINVSVENESDRVSYYFNIIKYHTRYNALTKNEIINGLLKKSVDNQGFIGLPKNEKISINNDKIISINKKNKISAKNLEYLNKIIALAKENNIKLIIVKSPCLLTEEDQKKYNWVEEYVKDKNIYYIDYNKSKINFESGDFYDTGHLSNSGAIKVSKDFSEKLRRDFI